MTAAFVSTVIQGCTVIGAGIGLAADQSGPGRYRIPNERAEFIEKSREITIVIADSVEVSGFLLTASVATDTVFEISPVAPGESRAAGVRRRLQSITINTYGDRIDIPGDRVAAIYIPKMRNAVRNGALIGFICDVCFFLIPYLVIISGPTEGWD